MFARHSAGLRSKKLNIESLERRALLASDAMAAAAMGNPVIVEAQPSNPNGAQLVSPGSAPGNTNPDFASNGPNPTTSTGAMVASPYLGNNPWLDDVFTMGNSSTPNAGAYGPLYQPYFTTMQEYAQYEEAVQAIAAQQAAQQMAAGGNLG